MAVAYDATSKGTVGAGNSTLTFSHTITGANTILMVGVCLVQTNGAAISSATFNGVSMTAVYNYAPSGTRSLAYFYLINPAGGAHNIVVTLTGNTDIAFGAVGVSYNGVSQAAFPDSNNKVDSSAAVSSLSVSTTTVANNAWLVGFCYSILPGTPTAGANTTQRNSQVLSGLNDAIIASDSNAPQTPAGSYSLTTNFSTSGGSFQSYMIASAAPVPVLTTGNSFLIKMVI